MGFKILCKASVESDLKRLDRRSAAQILDEIELELGRDRLLGKPLKGPFKGLFRYRIGDYRVVYALTKNGILVVRVCHRRDVSR